MGQTETNSLNRDEHLPQFYGEDLLVILPRDPYCIFAYWEFGCPAREALEEQAGGEQQPGPSLQLRVFKHDWGDGESVESYFDLSPGWEDDSRYIPVPEADRLYHVELGWTPAQGSFQSLLRSNSIRTPRDRISDLVDEEWQLPDWKAQKLFRRISLYHLSSAEFLRRAKKII